MFCSACGNELSNEPNFCSACGGKVGSPDLGSPSENEGNGEKPLSEVPGEFIVNFVIENAGNPDKLLSLVTLLKDEMDKLGHVFETHSYVDDPDEDEMLEDEPPIEPIDEADQPAILESLRLITEEEARYEFYQEVASACFTARIHKRNESY